MNRFPFALLVFMAALGTILNCRTLCAQGALTPPGAPTPTMKTLDQIEPRTILNTANCPGDASNIFIITQPGAYYLTANIAGTSGHNGIQVAADNVTIDLKGFTVSGGAGSLTGIITGGSHRGTRIVNGHVTDWPSAGIRLVGAGSAVSDVTVLNSGNAIVLDQQASTQILRCAARDINVGSSPDACFVADQIDTCSVHNLSGGANVTGINAYALAVNCSVLGANGTAVTGISGNGSVSNCTVLTLIGTTITGIGAGSVERCVVSSVGSSSTTSLVGISGSLVTACKVAGMNQGAGSASASSGISAFSCIDSQVFNVVFSSSAFTWGIKAAELVKGCSVTNVQNSGVGSGAGIGLNFQTTSTGIVTNSRVDACEKGIVTVNGCQVSNCVAVSCKAVGIQVGQRCSVLDCTSASNGTLTTAAGISADIRSNVSRCKANENTGDGIAFMGDCFVEGCTAGNNGTGSGVGAIGSGLHVTSGSGSRIQGNHVRDNHRYGVEAGGSDVIVRNTSANNGLGQYLPNSGANFGTLQTPATATNPEANF